MIRKTLLLLLFTVIHISAFADLGGFCYEEIRFDALVHKDNVWDITMTQKVNFLAPRHGVYFYIPTEFYISHEDRDSTNGDTSKRLRYVADVTDISVEGDLFSVSEENGNTVIKIGDKNTLLTGQKEYVIRYRYKYPDDRVRERDIVFHSILGTGFTAPIHHFSYSVRFEKPLSDSARSAMKIYSGAYGSRGNRLNVSSQWHGNTVLGSAPRDIDSSCGVTLFMPLEEGYFEGVPRITPKYMYTFFFLALVFALIIIVRSFLIRHPHVTKQIEFYPPDGMCSAEVGTITDNTPDQVDIASMIPWFASKGYITITEEEKSGTKKTSTTKLRIHKKAKLPADAPEYQKMFFKVLFEKNDSVRLDKVKQTPQQMMQVIKSLQNTFQGSRKLVNTNLGILLYLPLLIFSTLSFATSSEVTYYDAISLVYALLLWMMPFLAGFVFNLYIAERKHFVSSKIKTAYIIFSIVMASGLCILYLTTKEADMMPDALAVILFIACFFSVERVYRFSVNSEYRTTMIGKLLGLKEFIETAEKDRLEMLLHDDPQYFYRIMPYAMVFGLTEIWSEHFKDLTVQRPEWYATENGSLSAVHYALLMQTLCTNSTHAVTLASSPSSSSSGGGFSGGGFAGGGGGGGGGGSW